MGCVLQQWVSGSAAAAAGQDRRDQTAKSRKQTKGSQPDRRWCLIAIGRLTQQLGAKAARPEQRECFEALAARQRSLFSAAMNAARGPDGVPDSPAPAAAPSPGMELAGALQRLRYRLASHQPPAHGSLGSEIQGATREPPGSQRRFASEFWWCWC